MTDTPGPRRAEGCGTLWVGVHVAPFFGVLEEAVLVARRKGYAVEGYFVCRDDDGWAAWLFALRGTEHDEEPIWRESAIHETIDGAAADCLLRAHALPTLDAPAEA